MVIGSGETNLGNQKRLGRPLPQGDPVPVVGADRDSDPRLRPVQDDGVRCLAWCSPEDYALNGLAVSTTSPSSACASVSSSLYLGVSRAGKRRPMVGLSIREEVGAIVKAITRPSSRLKASRDLPRGEKAKRLQQSSKVVGSSINPTWHSRPCITALALPERVTT